MIDMVIKCISSATGTRTVLNHEYPILSTFFMTWINLLTPNRISFESFCQKHRTQYNDHEESLLDHFGSRSFDFYRKLKRLRHHAKKVIYIQLKAVLMSRPFICIATFTSISKETGLRALSFLVGPLSGCYGTYV